MAPHGVPGVTASTTTNTGPVVTKFTATLTDVTTSVLPAGTVGVTWTQPEASLAPAKFCVRVGGLRRRRVHRAPLTLDATPRLTDLGGTLPVPESVTKTFEPVTADAATGNPTAATMTQMIMVS